MTAEIAAVIAAPQPAAVAIDPIDYAASWIQRIVACEKALARVLALVDQVKADTDSLKELLAGQGESRRRK